MWVRKTQAGCVSKTLMGACHENCATCSLGAIVTSVRAQQTPWEHLQRHCPLTTAAKGSTHPPITVPSFYSLGCKTLALAKATQEPLNSCRCRRPSPLQPLQSKLLLLPCRGDQGRLSYTFQDTTRSSPPDVPYYLSALIFYFGPFPTWFF